MRLQVFNSWDPRTAYYDFPELGDFSWDVKLPEDLEELNDYKWYIHLYTPEDVDRLCELVYHDVEIRMDLKRIIIHDPFWYPGEYDDCPDQAYTEQTRRVAKQILSGKGEC